MSTELQTLATAVKANEQRLDTITKSVDTLVKTLSDQRMPGHPDPRHVFGVPNIRTGEDPMSSRGFSFMKMLGLITQAVHPEDAKIEQDIGQRLHNAVATGKDCYEYGGGGSNYQPRGRYLAPLCTSYLSDTHVDRNFRNEMKSLVAAGSDGSDLDYMRWTANQLYTKPLDSQTRFKALSWLNELTGGSLAAPAEQGELIELLRNKEALVNAGARVVPLPPQGRLKYPRQTSPSTTYWVGENSPIPESIVGTGEVTLQAKKLAVLIKAPNELIRFASPAAEALLRDDMTKSLALGLDLAGLEGQGGDTRPLGLINFQNINTVVSSNNLPNGDGIVGQDVYRMIAAVEESNAEFEAWIMRPKTLYKYYQLRGDAIGQGDSSGPFLFNIIREAGDGVQPLLGGYPVVKSTQVSQSIVEGTATNLTYVAGGMFSDMLIGMFGAIEFAATALGDSAFQLDQSWIRGILSADIQARHQSAFVWMNNLNTQI